MEAFITIAQQGAQLGISDLTPTHLQVIRALMGHTAPSDDGPRDVRQKYRERLQAAKRSGVATMPELTRHVGFVQPETHFPGLTLETVPFAPDNPLRIEVPMKYTLDRAHTWRHRTLVQHTFEDRLYQSSDTDLANPRRILTLTIGRCGEILGAAETPNHDRAFLLALYAATIGLEAQMRQGHPRFLANIAGTSIVNRHRIRFYTSALDFLKVHVENLLRIAPELHP